MLSLTVLSLIFSVVQCAPKLRVYPERQTPPQLLNLPSNATSIRIDITDSFSCEGREYGYYADTDNECQIFHVCLPVRYSDGRNQTFRWSFICPDETIFNQEIFTCTNADESINCMDSPQFYSLNSHFGEEPEKHDDKENKRHKPQQIEDTVSVPEVPQNLEKPVPPPPPPSMRRTNYDYKRKTLENNDS